MFGRALAPGWRPFMNRVYWLFLLLVHCVLVNIFILLSPSGVTELLD